MAKLRLHTDITLDIMDKLTTELGQAFRDFRDKVCSVYETRELPRETAKRQRRAAKKVASQLHPEASGPDQTTNQPKRANKKVILKTYHYLSHLYNFQLVSASHRKPQNC